MKNHQRYLALALLCAALFAAALPRPAEPQIRKKVKKRVQEEVKKVGGEVEDAVRCALGDEECVEEAKAQGKEVVRVDDEGNVVETSPDGAGSTASETTRAGLPDSAPPAVPAASASVPQIEAPAPPPVPNRLYFFISADRWHAGQNKLVDPGWLTVLDYRGRPEILTGNIRNVVGRPNFIFRGRQHRNIARTSLQRTAPFGFESGLGSGVLYEREGKQVGSRGLTREDFPREAFHHADRRRVVFIRDGDVWRAEFDWGKNAFVNEKQVTSIGLLKGKQPLYWYGNDLYILGGFSEEKPIVRIGLLSGEVTEMEHMNVFKGGGNNREFFTNPSRSKVCRSDGELLYCYEAGSRQTFRFSVADPSPTTNRARQGSLLPKGTYIHRRAPSPLVWLNDDVFAYTNDGGVSRIDLKARRADLLVDVEHPQNSLSQRAVLPGSRWIELGLQPSGGFGAGRPDDLQRFLLDLTDGSTEPLSLPHDTNGRWLDTQRYFYGKRDGGLSNVGAWIYTRKNDRARRVCQAVPMVGGGDNGSELLFPSAEALYFVSSTGGSGETIWRVDLENDTCSKVAEVPRGEYHGRPLNRIEGEPVDLGFGGEPAWSATRSAPAGSSKAKGSSSTGSPTGDGRSENGQPEGSPSPSTALTPPATGMERILQATEDLDHESREEVKDAYRASRNDYILGNLFDPTCVALSFWEVRQPQQQVEEMNTTWQRWLGDVSNFSNCSDRAGIVRYARERIEKVRPPENYTEAQMDQLKTCVSEQLADYLVAEPTTNATSLHSFFSDYLIDCYQKLRSGG